MNHNDSERPRALIEGDEILIILSAMDPLTAMVVERVGYPAAYEGSTSISKLGYPTAGFLSTPELVENARNIRQAGNLPHSGHR